MKRTCPTVHFQGTHLPHKHTPKAIQLVSKLANSFYQFTLTSYQIHSRKNHYQKKLQPHTTKTVEERERCRKKKLVPRSRWSSAAGSGSRLCWFQFVKFLIYPRAGAFFYSPHFWSSFGFLLSARTHSNVSSTEEVCVYVFESLRLFRKA